MLTATRGPYVLVIQPDDDPLNPREDDNFGKMVCFHRRYHLGDHHNYIDKDDFLRDLYLKTVGDDERGAHRYERALDLMNYKIKAPFGSPAYEREVDERLMKVISQKFLMLPLYLYDHSGITMNTTGFSCPWDSGQVGWIYASKEDALREFGGKTFTAATRKKAEDRMRGEVEYYDSYLRGEAYGFELYKDGELEDSCWGFIGSNEEALKGIEDYLPDECSGMTGELVERDSPRSMLKMFLDHARVQVTQAAKDFEKAPRQQTLQTEAPAANPPNGGPVISTYYIYHAKGGCDCRKNLNGNPYP